MRNLFIFGAGLLAAWFGGESLASWLYGKIGGDWEIALWGARFLAFLGGSLAAQILLGLRRKSGGGVSAGGMTMILRPVTGWLIGLTVQAAVLFGFLFILVALINVFLPIPNDVVREQAVAASVLMTGLVYWLFFGWNGERDWVYRLLGKLTSPLRRLLRVMGFGKGGSAAFAGLFAEWDNLWRPGSILLGRSAYGKEWSVGLSDDRHLLTNRIDRGRQGTVGHNSKPADVAGVGAGD